MLSLGRCIVAGAVAAFFTTAGAQQGPCKDDVAKLCKDVQPGQGRMLECLRTNEAQLSPKCATHLKEVKQQLKQVSDACEKDMERFCWETEIGKGGIASCLKQHSSELSPDCKAAVEKAKAKK